MDSEISSGWYATDESGQCLRKAFRLDVYYEELSCLYPTLGKTYMNWEFPARGSDRVLTFMENNPWFPLVAVALYAYAIFAGQKYMEDKPAWDWRYQLAAWNLFLALFSLFGVIRTLPHVLHNLYYYDLKTNVCTEGYILVGYGPTAYWTLIFAWSKFFELFDTFFIVVRKKKLVFLHWYHHITVLICCWGSIVSRAPAGIIFALVNFGVHSVMYFYYFLQAIKKRPSWFNPKAITAVQILQMVIGVTISIRAWSWAHEENCHASLLNIKGTLAMYASYLYLFVQFFLRRYYNIATKAKIEVKNEGEKYKAS